MTIARRDYGSERNFVIYKSLAINSGGRRDPAQGLNMHSD